MMQIMVNFQSAHMDTDDWENPQEFRPERFLDESVNVIDRERVIPFSLGISTTYMNTFSLLAHYVPNVAKRSV